jgi:hypothetical protein
MKLHNLCGTRNLPSAVPAELSYFDEMRRGFYLERENEKENSENWEITAHQLRQECIWLFTAARSPVA